MDPIAISLAAACFFVIMGTIALYFAKIADAKIGLGVASLVVKLVVGLGLGAASITWATRNGALGPLVIAPVAVAAFFAIFMLWLLSLRRTPVGEIKVSVGDKLLPFVAQTPEGLSFDSGETEGQRLLLKFFRGGW